MSVTVGRRAFVTVQAMAEPGAVCAAVKFNRAGGGVDRCCVPPPVPVHETLTAASQPGWPR